QPSTKVVQALQQGNATITQPSATNRIASYLCANPRHSLAAISIISFVLCNTAFLAFEQQKGFVTLGYSVPVAWGIAVLFELAIEILFISIALSKHSFMRIALCLVLGSTVYTLANMVSTSAEENVLAAINKPTSLTTAEQNLRALSSQQFAASEAIRSYDPKKHKNKIIYATAEFNKKGGLEDKIKKARTELAEEQAKFESSVRYIRTLKQSETHGDARKIAVAWNIVLMFFLGHLIREDP
ncbi:MAG: hypothetical protein AB8G05_12890, partial [Oligoflexales bacterium]